MPQLGCLQCIAITTTHAELELQQADLILDGYQQLDIRKWLQNASTLGVS